MGLGSILRRVFGGSADRGATGGLVSTTSSAQMADAMRQARETLPVFWEWLDSHQESDDPRAIKVGFSTRHKSIEYIWLVDIRRVPELVVTGIVSNQPEDVPELKEGEIVPINPETVADWTFRQDGLFYGHFTTRVLARSNPSMAAGMKTLSPTPLPDQVLR